MTQPRLFLVAPADIPPDRLLDCLAAAGEAGDVACLLVPAALARAVTAAAQQRGVAVIVSGDPREAPRNQADGVQVEATAEAVAEARSSVGKDRFVGAFAGDSRHFAMEAAEAGADYVALSQNGRPLGGEPIVKWWSDMMEIPAVAFDPVEPSDLDILLPQNPDFIRPADGMWTDAETARRMIGEISKRLSRP